MNTLIKLNDLLNEPIDRAIEREKTTFDSLSSPFADSLVLVGAGGLGRRTLHGLRRVGIEPRAFVDNNSSIWGSMVDGLRILSPKDAVQEFGHTAAFVVTIWRAGGGHRFELTRRQLTNLGCLKVVSFAALYWKYPHIFLSYYALSLPHNLLEHAKQIVKAYALWTDDASRYEYLAQIRWRLWLDFEGLPSPSTYPQYFPDDLFDLREDENFADCGAFDGDTLRIYFQQQRVFNGKYLAVEPDPINLKSLKDYAASLPETWRERITILPMALGAYRDIVCFSASGLPSAGICPDGEFEVERAPLDEILSDTGATFIKMDIEGAEVDALIGARRTIEKNLPVLAICVYHQPDHLWRIPLLIKSFSDQYRFFLRAYNEEGWDVVCYAVPASRLKVKSEQVMP